MCLATYLSPERGRAVIKEIPMEGPKQRIATEVSFFFFRKQKTTLIFINAMTGKKYFLIIHRGWLVNRQFLRPIMERGK